VKKKPFSAISFNRAITASDFGITIGWKIVYGNNRQWRLNIGFKSSGVSILLGD
jgi:hypothetical protein